MQKLSAAQCTQRCTPKRGRSNTQQFKADIAGWAPGPNSALNVQNRTVGSDMGKTIKQRRVRRRATQYRRGLPSGGMSKAQLRELGRAAVEGTKITVPPGKKGPANTQD